MTTLAQFRAAFLDSIVVLVEIDHELKKGRRPKIGRRPYM